MWPVGSDSPLSDAESVTMVGTRRRKAPAASRSERTESPNHFRVNLRQAADVPVRRLVRLALGRILTLHLHRANQLVTTADIFGDDEIETFVAMREIDVPPFLGEPTCDE